MMMGGTEWGVDGEAVSSTFWGLALLSACSIVELGSANVFIFFLGGLDILLGFKTGCF